MGRRLKGRKEEEEMDGRNVDGCRKGAMRRRKEGNREDRRGRQKNN